MDGLYVIPTPHGSENKITGPLQSKRYNNRNKKVVTVGDFNVRWRAYMAALFEGRGGKGERVVGGMRAVHAEAAQTAPSIGNAGRVLEHDVARRENLDSAHNE